MTRWRALLWSLFWFMLGTAVWGAYEIAYDSPLCHPVWSGTWGPPVPHHYIIGFIGAATSIILIQIQRVKYE